MSTDLVLVSTPTPGVTQLTLNRPEKRNALSVPLLQAMVETLDRVEGDPSQRILMLTGSGAVFCAGLDLTEANDPKIAHLSADLISTVLRRLIESRLITIAVVQGGALAGGAGLMSACDFAYAEGSAQIGYPEPKRGLVAALVMTLLRRQLRERDARRLLLTGESVSGTEAAAMGLVNAAVGSEQIMQVALRTATQVLQGGPEAVVRTKRLFNDLWPATIAADFAKASQVHLEARGSAETQEGVAAFREKRKPAWAKHL